MDPRPHSNPLTLREKRNLMRAVERAELLSKGHGRVNGWCGQCTLRVLRCLLFDFHNEETGLCCPSIAAIRKKTGLCRSSIFKAIKILESAGILRRARRIVKKVNRWGQLVCEQGSNLYAILNPQRIWKPKVAPAARKFNDFGRVHAMDRNHTKLVRPSEDTSFRWLFDDVKVGFQGVQAASTVDWKARTRTCFHF
jgi:hypothetical protein